MFKTTITVILICLLCMLYITFSAPILTTVEPIKEEVPEPVYDEIPYCKYCIEGYVFIHIPSLGELRQLKDAFNCGIRCEE